MPAVTAFKIRLCRIAAQTVGNRSTVVPPLSGRQPIRKSPTYSVPEQKMMNKKPVAIELELSLCHRFSVSYSRYKLYTSIISRIPTFIPSSNALFSQAQHTLPCLTIISSQRGTFPPTQSTTILSIPGISRSHASNSLSRALAALPAAVVFGTAGLFSVYVS